MPKIVEYPRKSLKSALALAEAVESLGGTCSDELAAEKLNLQLSGAFNAQISAASKFGLIKVNKGQLKTTPQYRRYTLAYNEQERLEVLRIALLSPPIFRAVYQRFQGRKLPIGHFDKLLIREFDVPQNMASRVATYFVNGAKQTKLINQDNQLLPVPELQEENDGSDELNQEVSPIAPREDSTDASVQFEPTGVSKPPMTSGHDYAIRIYGPGMDSTIAIRDPEDLDIVRAMLKKVERRLRTEPDDGDDMSS